MCLPETHNALLACVILLLLISLPALSGISWNMEQKIIILQIIKQLIQYTFFDLQFWCLKYMVIIKIRKNLSLSAFYHSYPSGKRQTGFPLQGVDVNNSLQTVFRHVYTVYNYSNCMINQLLYC